jgi:hypothetical protein
MEPIKITKWIKKTESKRGLYDLYLFNTSDTYLLTNSIRNDTLCSKNYPELDLKTNETIKIEITITKVEEKQ